MNLHLALRTPENWRTVAEVRLDAVASGVSAQVSYDFDYVIERILAVGEGEIGRAAVACGYPVRLEPHVRSHWPRFLDDLMPGGAARRWWVNRLGIADQPPLEQNLRLLSEAAMAPVGHLRVQEAVPPQVGAPLRFPRQAVADRDHGFLDHAAEMGASVGGATGAGGEAPKLLLRLADDGQVWLDTWQDRVTPDRAYLVKFARHRRSAIDRAILRAEYVYYRALAELGIDTIDSSGIELVEGQEEPSLWLPRFDVVGRGGTEERLGMESVSSLVEAAPGSWLSHQDCLAALQRVMASNPGHDPAALVARYLERDLLNVVFGNTDNHGRNTAILKDSDGIRLAPVFDFAPMKLDPEGIVRTTRWAVHERGGDVDWRAVCGSLSGYGPPEGFWESLRQLAEKLQDLPDRLRSLGLAAEVLEHPRLGLLDTRARLRGWGLLP